jgi:hypothetical protein
MADGGGGKEAGKDECVRVIVRCRPFNSKEKKEGNERAVYVNTKDHTIEVRDCSNPKLAPKRWTFDGTFDENCMQRDIYDSAAAAIVDDVLTGFNGTIFAYGQTGACVPGVSERNCCCGATSRAGPWPIETPAGVFHPHKRVIFAECMKLGVWLLAPSLIRRCR